MVKGYIPLCVRGRVLSYDSNYLVIASHIKHLLQLVTGTAHK